MENIINFIKDYWSLALLIIAGVTIGFIYARNFLKKPSEVQLKSIRAWLLSAVTLAEKEFGSGTGAVKLSYVYSLFIEKFPYFANMISFDFFSTLVDEVLDRFRNILKSNNNLQSYVNAAPVVKIEAIEKSEQ